MNKLNWKLKVHKKTMTRLREDELMGIETHREYYLEEKRTNVRKEMERYVIMADNVWKTMECLREAGFEDRADDLWEFWEIDLGHEIEAMMEEYTKLGVQLEEAFEENNKDGK